MTVNMQNVGFLPGAAGNGAAVRSAGGEQGTPFLDLMVALGAESEVAGAEGLVRDARSLLDAQAGGAAQPPEPGVQLRPIELHVSLRAAYAAAAAQEQGEPAEPKDPVAAGGDLLQPGAGGCRVVRAESAVRTEGEEAVDKVVAAVEQPLSTDAVVLPMDAASAQIGAAVGLDQARAAVEPPATSKAATQSPIDSARPALVQAAITPELQRAAAKSTTRGNEFDSARLRVAGQLRGQLQPGFPVGAAPSKHEVAQAILADAHGARDGARARDATEAFSEALGRASGAVSGDGGGGPAFVAAKEVRAPLPASMQVAEPFGGQRWGAAMNTQVLTMMRDGVAQARVEINPVNLGPVGIDVSMRDGVVNVSFDSPHAEVRDAIKDGVKGLERSLMEGGVQLGRMEVRDTLEFAGQGRGQRDSNPQQDASGGQRQQQEQSRRGASDFAAHLQAGEESGES